MIVPYIEAEGSKYRNLHAFEIFNTKWVLENTVLRKLVISKATRMVAKYFLKQRLPFQYDPISRNLEMISPIRLKIANQRFELDFKLGKRGYKRVANIKQEKRLPKLKGREPKEEEITIPPIQIPFPKAVYVMHYKDKTYIPTQGLVVIGINTLEQDDNKVKSFMRKPTSGKKVPKLGDPRGSYSLQKVNNNVVLVCFLCFMFYVFIYVFVFAFILNWQSWIKMLTHGFRCS